VQRYSSSATRSQKCRRDKRKCDHGLDTSNARADPDCNHEDHDDRRYDSDGWSDVPSPQIPTLQLRPSPPSASATAKEAVARAADGEEREGGRDAWVEEDGRGVARSVTKC
jgi:hypothetical protein